MIKGILFDMDGVLVDSEDVMIKSSLDVLHNKYNIDAEYDDFKPFTGMGEDRFIGGVVEKHGGKYITSMKDDAYARYAELKDGIFVFEGTTEMIKTLFENEYKLAVCSSADRVKVNINVKACKADKYIHEIISGNEVVRKKPFPDIYLEGARRLNLKPEECIVVEDAVSGIKAAKNAGMLAFGVTTSFPERDLFDAGADFVKDKNYLLIDVLKEINK